MLVSFLAGALLGLSLAAPPGPMNAIIAEESVLRGWTAGFLAGLGAMSADATFFVVALLGAVPLVRSIPGLRSLMLILGGLLMLWFAVGALRGAKTAFSDDRPPADGRGFSRAFVLALTNPYQLLWWATVGVALLEPGRFDLGEVVPLGLVSSQVVTGSPIIVVGFFGGIAAWIVAFPAMLVSIGDRVDGVAPVVASLSALVLAAFGVGFLLAGLGLL